MPRYGKPILKQALSDAVPSMSGRGIKNVGGELNIDYVLKDAGNNQGEP